MIEVISNKADYVNLLYDLITILFLIFLSLGIILRTYGISRDRFALTNIKILIFSFPLIVLSTYLFGWAISFAFSSGPIVRGGFREFSFALPWSEFMGSNLDSNPTFINEYKQSPMSLIKFILLSWSLIIFFGSAIIERVRIGAFLIFSIILGSLFWPICLSWSWSNNGWMSEVFGFHDAFGSGAFHTILGGFTLGVLGKVGSRKIKFNSFSRARDIPANSEISVIFGNILLIFGLFGLYLYSINPFSEIKNEFGSFVSTVNVYGNPISFYGILLNFIMGISGGLVISLVLSFNDNKKIFIGGIVGIVSISAGADYYHPIHCLLISMAVSLAVFKSFNYIEERFKIDDASDIVVSHGFAGFWGLVIASILLWGYPSSIVENSVFTNPFGQFAGALIIFWLLGFIPGYLTASVLKFFKILHLSDTVKIIGQDILSTRDKIIETNNIYEAEKKIISEMKSNKK
ncbi:hypothetical protein OAS25_01615 [Alphaproteobacteria bacterium]|nr:hypothetical protein [Alphaproteobacteria bacterium]